MSRVITYVIWRADLGGIEKSLFNYINSLGLRYTINIFSLKRPNTNIFNKTKANVYYGGNGHIIAYLKYVKYILRNRAGIFHLLNTGPVVLFLSKIFSEKKIIYHIRGTK